MVIHRPLDEMDEHYQDVLIKLLRDFVNERGLEFQMTDLALRTFRTPSNVFVSCGDNKHRPRLEQFADAVWKLPGPEAQDISVSAHEN